MKLVRKPHVAVADEAAAEVEEAEDEVAAVADEAVMVAAAVEIGVEAAVIDGW
jgi:hypothetical protein